MSNDMNTYLIEPLAPLIVRSGRPFDEQTGADAARFPPPSTLAGALRTAYADAAEKALGPDLAQVAVAGPLPVRLDGDGKPVSLLVPKPADALYFRHGGGDASKMVRALPVPLAAGEGMDLPDALLPVQLAAPEKGKPGRGPRWWAWDDLTSFRNGGEPPLADIALRGWTPPPDDVRTHVAIERVSQAADAGKLFQTAGLSFSPGPPGKGRFPEGRIGIVGRIAGEVAAGLVTLGGERRLSAVAPAPQGIWPVLPPELCDAIRRAGGVCLTLLTPALFTGGWKPGWLDARNEGRPNRIPGLKLALRAAAIDRWQPHSGWDLVARGPRAGRKCVPAGAVYWFEVLEASDDALAALWLTPLSDLDQDRRDGFGLAVPHAWTPPNAHPSHRKETR